MDWTSVKSALATVAPAIGTVLGGPLGGAAGAALSAVLGGDATDPTKVAAAIAGATPDQLLALKKADQDFQLQMQALGFKNVADLASLEVDDRKSARDMAVTTKSMTPSILTFLITAGFFGVLTFLCLQPVPDQSRDILNIMLGSLGTAWIASITYWFGSTNGSMAKSQMLANSTPTK